MQQQQRGLFGIARLAIEDLDIANGNRPIPGDRLSGHRWRKAAQQSDCCKGCGEKRATHRKDPSVGDWRMVAQSANLRSIISLRDNHLLIGYIISKFGRMRLSRISDLQAFVAVVEKASLTSAAHQLGRSLQSVSRSLAAIEQDVGVELIRRTTRRSNPTEAGLAYYQRLKTALEDIEEAKLQVSASQARAIRVAADQRSNRICSAASGSGDGCVPQAPSKNRSRSQYLRPLCRSRRRQPRPCRSYRAAARLGGEGQAPCRPPTGVLCRTRLFRQIRPAETPAGSCKASMHRSHGARRCGYLAIHGGRQGPDDQGVRAFSRQWRQCRQRGGNSWPGNCHRPALAYPAIDRSRAGRSGSRPICATDNSGSRHLVRDARAACENAHVHRFPEPTDQGGALVATPRTHPIVSATRPIALRSINSRIAFA